MFGRTRTPKLPPDDEDLVRRLRSASRNLRSWTVSGDGISLDRLLLEAAARVEEQARTEAREEVA